jgi:hypothetical protein
MTSQAASMESLNARALPVAAIAAARALPLSTLVLVLVLIITGGAG